LLASALVVVGVVLLARTAATAAPSPSARR
jgi:hypothetical protein